MRNISLALFSSLLSVAGLAADVSIHVIDPDANAVSTARIAIYQTDNNHLVTTLASDSTGAAVLKNIAPGSYRVEARAIVERAHRVGALVVLDTYQSAGVLELKAEEWGVDFLIGGTIKWLCGGPACGYLYVRPELQGELRPRLTGWVAHEEPFAFARQMRYARGVRRFAQGTPNIPGLHSCLAGLDIIEEVGLERIAAESRRRTEWMVGFALEHGWRLNSPRETEERGGSVMIGVGDAPETVARLAERKVFVDWRPDVGLRISPHFFNTDEEVRDAMLILKEVMSDKEGLSAED